MHTDTSLIVKLPWSIVDKYFEIRPTDNADKAILKPTEEYLCKFREWYKSDSPADAKINPECVFGEIRIIDEDKEWAVVRHDLDLCKGTTILAPEFLIKFFKEFTFEFAIETYFNNYHQYDYHYYVWDRKLISENESESGLAKYFRDFKNKENEEMAKEMDREEECVTAEDREKDLFNLLDTLGMIEEDEYSLEEFRGICENLPETMSFVSDLFTNNDSHTIEKLLVNLIYRK